MGPCSGLWHQYWVAAEYHLRKVPVVQAPAPLDVCGHQRLAAKGAEAH